MSGTLENPRENRLWWETLLFRLSGPENAVVWALIAGNPNLPPVALEVLAQDDDVLEEVFNHRNTPLEHLKGIIRKGIGDTLTKDHADTLLHRHPDLSEDALTDLWAWFKYDPSSEICSSFINHPHVPAAVLGAALRSVDEWDGLAALNKQLEHRPLETHREFWNEAIERTDLSRLLWWPALPSKWLEDWLKHELLMRELGQSELEYEGMSELVKHPNASQQIFVMLLDSEHFLLGNEE